MQRSAGQLGVFINSGWLCTYLIAQSWQINSKLSEPEDAAGLLQLQTSGGGNLLNLAVLAQEKEPAVQIGREGGTDMSEIYETLRKANVYRQVP